VTRYVLGDMKDIVTCLAYLRPDASHPEPVLCIGDDGGHVFVLHFLKHSQSLFKKTGVDDVQHINWRELYLQAGMIQLSVLPGCHKGPVVQLDLKRSIHQLVVSSSKSPQMPLLIRHVRAQTPAIIFRTGYGMVCFDYDEDRGVIATGSSDTKIRLWSATNEAKPWMTLTGHPATIAAVSLQQEANFLWSLCERSELRYWDLNEVECMRTIRLEFPLVQSSGKTVNPFTRKLLAVRDSVILVCCGDQIGAVRLTESGRCDLDGPSSAPSSRSRSCCPSVDETAAYEEKIPVRFRETLLDFGARHEDVLFDHFIEELKRIFEQSPSATQYLARLGELPEVDVDHPSGIIYDWEETMPATMPAKLVPLNQFKLRELERMGQMKRDVANAVPLCALTLPSPRRITLPPALPVTQRMRRRGVDSWTDFEHLRSADADVFGDGFSDLSSARSSLASSVLSYYRQKKVKEVFRFSSRKSSVDASPRSDPSHEYEAN